MQLFTRYLLHYFPMFVYPTVNCSGRTLPLQQPLGSCHLFQFMVKMPSNNKSSTDEEDQVIQIIGNFGKWQAMLILPLGKVCSYLLHCYFDNFFMSEPSVKKYQTSINFSIFNICVCTWISEKTRGHIGFFHIIIHIFIYV